MSFGLSWSTSQPNIFGRILFRVGLIQKLKLTHLAQFCFPACSYLKLLIQYYMMMRCLHYFFPEVAMSTNFDHFFCLLSWSDFIDPYAVSIVFSRYTSWYPLIFHMKCLLIFIFFQNMDLKNPKIIKNL